jgi:hypothetical protein
MTILTWTGSPDGSRPDHRGAEDFGKLQQAGAGVGLGLDLNVAAQVKLESKL